jgi:peroxiredoxin
MAFGRHKRLLAEGSKAPDFELPRLDGASPERLAGIIAAGPALLAFFKISCPVCQFALPYLERIHTPGRLPVFTVSQNGPEDTKQFNRAYGITVPTLLDEESRNFPASNAFGISTVPTLFVVERDGTVSRVVEGWSRRDIEHLAAIAGVQPFREGERIPDWKSG